MKALQVSIGTLSVNVRSDRAHAEGQEEITVQVDWRTLREAWTAAKVYTLARLRDLLAKYDNYQTEKHKEYMTKWPPHSIFCEKRCCQKSSSSYLRHLKKELRWDSNGHLI